MEVALLSHQSMVVAPLLYPRGEISQPIEAEAHGPPELLLYVVDLEHMLKVLLPSCAMVSGSQLCGITG